MNIHVLRLPHSSQRYDTCGDWWFEADELMVRVSSMSNWRYEFLVGLHEIIEAMLCWQQNISEESVTAFDKAFEAAREPGNTDEPGNDKAAPYHWQHRIATLVEWFLHFPLGVNWKEYSREIENL